MDAVNNILHVVLGFLLSLAQLIGTFIISALTLFLDFFRTLVGLVQ